MSNDSTLSTADLRSECIAFRGTHCSTKCLSIGSTKLESECLTDCQSICSTDGGTVCRTNYDTDCSTEYGGRFEATNTKSNAPSIVF